MILLFLFLIMFLLYVLKQMKNDTNINYLYGFNLPVLRVVPTYGDIVIKILIVIAVILLLYIIYLYLRGLHRSKVANKETVKNQNVYEKHTVIKEKETVIVKQDGEKVVSDKPEKLEEEKVSKRKARKEAKRAEKEAQKAKKKAEKEKALKETTTDEKANASNNVVFVDAKDEKAETKQADKVKEEKSIEKASKKDAKRAEKEAQKAKKKSEKEKALKETTTDEKDREVVNEEHTVENDDVAIKAHDSINQTDNKVVVTNTTSKIGVSTKKVPRTILNYSFRSRMHLAEKEAWERYETVRSKLLSYEDVISNETWKYERYLHHGKSVVKVKLQGKTMRLFFGLDPKDIVDEKYKIEDVGDKQTHENTPSLLIVKGPRGVKYACELIELYMSKNHIKAIENYKYEPLKFKRLSKLQLLKQKLIKTNDATFIARLEEEERQKAMNK